MPVTGFADYQDPQPPSSHIPAEDLTDERGNIIERKSGNGG